MNNEIKEILDILEGRKKWYLHQQKNNSPFNDEDYIAYMVLDYITNLQQENERLKVNCNLGYEELKVARNYKSRCEKAIEYINTHYEIVNGEKLLNILQNGSDK